MLILEELLDMLDDALLLAHFGQVNEEDVEGMGVLIYLIRNVLEGGQNVVGQLLNGAEGLVFHFHDSVCRDLVDHQFGQDLFWVVQDVVQTHIQSGLLQSLDLWVYLFHWL